MKGYREMDIRELRRTFPVTIDDNLADDLFIADIEYTAEMSKMSEMLKYPCRFKGYLAFFCQSGHFDVDVNLQTYEVAENCLFLYIPGNVVRVSKIYSQENKTARCVVVAISTELVASSRIDFNKLFEEGQRLLTNPCLVLRESEKAIFGKYLDIFRETSALHLPNSRDVISSLISAVIYLSGSLFIDRLTEAKHQFFGKSTRSKLIFEDFMNLVKDYHNSEREIAFYANRLYLTPKYLSKLVKNISGRSAHDWIDSFVILEAKNLLKYSDLSIKEIVYDLNFPSQASFYRFFKENTGMTPTQYRKS